MNGSGWFKLLAAGLAVSLLAACEEDGRLSRNTRHFTPVPAKMVALMQEKGTSKQAPILLRAYKQESELEVWKQTASGQYVHLKTYPMCRWSGQLGPKVREGDRQVPEGFYSITPASLNPNSSFYLSFNVGYPNAYDRAHGRTGSAIMVHGACSSAGCFSMTDEQIAEIYAITREAFAGGQKAIQLQSFPFRFSPQNLAKYRADPNMPFWKMLKEGADTFEVTKQEPQVSLCEARYAFNRAGQADGAPGCAPSDEASPVVRAVAAKAAADDQKVAELVASGVGAVRRVYKDGDQHHSFRHTQYADAAIVRTSPSRVAEVSRPDALEHGPVEIPVDQIKGKKSAAALASARLPLQTVTTPAATPAATPTATPAPAVTTPNAQVGSPAASAFAPTVASPAPSGLFRGWLGGAEPERPQSVTAIEPDRPQPVKIPLPPRAPQRPVGAPEPAKVDAPASVQPTASIPTALSGFTALIPGFK